MIVVLLQSYESWDIHLVIDLEFGIRNTNKYTKLYSGGTPIFEEDNIFRITIPMENVAELQVARIVKTTPKESRLGC